MVTKAQRQPYLFSILLADDDPDDCIFFKEAVEALQFTTSIIMVNDGEQLMQFLIKNNSPLPDALFLDLNMPRKNGFECLAEIKQTPLLQLLPVVIFSTSLEQDVVNQLYNNGAQYFIRKPADFFQFKKIIQLTIQLLSQNNITATEREDFVITV
jgi:CheY-like chemotaxis protein